MTSKTVEKINLSLKIAVMNFSGNVGKTTICDHLLKPHLNNPSIMSVESINQGATGDDVEHWKGKKFGELIDQLMILDCAIVDVGASNVEDFLKLMQQYAGSHEDFDYFIVPVTNEKKAQQDTINTIKALSVIGVPSNKIKLVFNKFDVDDSLESDFSSLMGFEMAEKLFTLNENCVIYQSEIYERLREMNISLDVVNNDETDYKAKLKDPKTKAEDKQKIVSMIGLKRLAVTANKNLSHVFENLFK